MNFDYAHRALLPPYGPDDLLYMALLHIDRRPVRIHFLEKVFNLGKQPLVFSHEYAEEVKIIFEKEASHITVTPHRTIVDSVVFSRGSVSIGFTVLPPLGDEHSYKYSTLKQSSMETASYSEVPSAAAVINALKLYFEGSFFSSPILGKISDVKKEGESYKGIFISDAKTFLPPNYKQVPLRTHENWEQLGKGKPYWRVAFLDAALSPDAISTAAVEGFVCIIPFVMLALLVDMLEDQCVPSLFRAVPDLWELIADRLRRSVRFGNEKNFPCLTSPLDFQAGLSLLLTLSETGETVQDASILSILDTVVEAMNCGNMHGDPELFLFSAYFCCRLISKSSGSFVSPQTCSSSVPARKCMALLKTGIDISRAALAMKSKITVQKRFKILQVPTSYICGKRKIFEELLELQVFWVGRLSLFSPHYPNQFNALCLGRKGDADFPLSVLGELGKQSCWGEVAQPEIITCGQRARGFPLPRSPAITEISRLCRMVELECEIKKSDSRFKTLRPSICPMLPDEALSSSLVALSPLPDFLSVDL